jgi:hypothetical protein
MRAKIADLPPLDPSILDGADLSNVGGCSVMQYKIREYPLYS